MKQIALKPRVSEKTYALSDQLNTYAFEVPAEANKHTIKEAVAKQFDVAVVDVRIAAVPGKKIRVYRKRARSQHNSKRSDIRKAYVTLKEGDKLPIFSESETHDHDKETK